jgi:K(+)-stimulated pyrophosphate-energized sodium pump
VIKFTTLFGLLAVEVAEHMRHNDQVMVAKVLAAVFFALSTVFVWRSFYGMRIKKDEEKQSSSAPAAPAATPTPTSTTPSSN